MVEKAKNMRLSLGEYSSFGLPEQLLKEKQQREREASKEKKKNEREEKKKRKGTSYVEYLSP